MRNFIIWLGIIILGFGAFFGISHVLYSANPSRVFIGIDVSQETEAHKRSINHKLAPWLGQRYQLFILASNVLNKNQRIIHTWQSVLDLSAIMDINMYTSLPLDTFKNLDEVKQADHVIIVTASKNSRDIDIPGAQIILLP